MGFAFSHQNSHKKDFKSFVVNVCSDAITLDEASLPPGRQTPEQAARQAQMRAIENDIANAVGWRVIYSKAMKSGAFRSIEEVYETDFEKVIQVISYCL